jgi:putative ABC transport system substrate-binding protein
VGFLPHFKPDAIVLCAALVMASVIFPACTAQTTTQVELTRVPRIGFLSGRTPATRDNEFQKGLEELGYVVEENVHIEYRLADGESGSLESLATELVSLGVDVIVATDSRAIAAAKSVTQTTPIVMVSPGDPVAAGFVETLARPGGNVTGLSSLGTELAPKRLELLKEVVPGLTHVAVLGDLDNPVRQLEFKATQAAGDAAGVRTTGWSVQEVGDVDPAIRAAAADSAQALIVFGDNVTVVTRDTIFGLSTEYSLPAVYEGYRRVLDGGLIAYGPILEERYRRSATYVDKILKGMNPAEIPVEEPTRFELAVNLKTAEELGLTIPATVLARADRVVR